MINQFKSSSISLQSLYKIAIPQSEKYRALFQLLSHPPQTQKEKKKKKKKKKEKNNISVLQKEAPILDVLCCILWHNDVICAL